MLPLWWAAKSGCAFSLYFLVFAFLTTVKGRWFLKESWWALYMAALGAFVPGRWFRAPAVITLTAAVGKKDPPHPSLTPASAVGLLAQLRWNKQQASAGQGPPFPCRRQVSIFPFCSCCLSYENIAASSHKQVTYWFLSRGRASLLCPAQPISGCSPLCRWRSSGTRGRLSWTLLNLVKIGYVSLILSIGVKSLQEAVTDHISNTIRITSRISFALGTHISQPVVLQETSLLPCPCLGDVCLEIFLLVTAEGRGSTGTY